MPYSNVRFAKNHPQAITQWLDIQLEQDIHTRARLFALLNVSALDTSSSALNGVTDLPMPLADGKNLYDDLAGTGLSEVGPRLFQVDEIHLQDWVLLAGKTAAISFIASLTSAGELNEHLQSLREVTLPDGAQALFRFQDTHVTTHLWPLLTPGQSNQLLGPALWWAVPDVCESYHLLTAASEYRRIGSLRLDRRQFDELNRLLHVYTVANQVRETDASLLHGLSACESRALLRSRLKAAANLGLTQQSDQALYVVLSLQLPDGFEHEQPFAKALEQNRQGLQTFGQALDQVPGAQWREWNDKLDAS